jgi:hypothetical protein
MPEALERKLPGDGDFPLAAFVAALRADMTVDMGVPSSRGLPPVSLLWTMPGESLLVRAGCGRWSVAPANDRRAGTFAQSPVSAFRAVTEQEIRHYSEKAWLQQLGKTTRRSRLGKRN